MNTINKWEASIKQLRRMPEQSNLVRDAYLDEDNLAAAKRFEKSEEFDEAMRILKGHIRKTPPWDILDMGAGNGIAAYAFAKAGHRVLALEPNPSSDVGANAVKRLSKDAGLTIELLESEAENVPLPKECVDIVYVRQSLHHARNLEKFLGGMTFQKATMPIYYRRQEA